MICKLDHEVEIDTRHDVRNVTIQDVERIAKAMLDAYMGTVDQMEDTYEEALAEVQKIFADGYGTFLPEASFLIEKDSEVASVILVSLYEGKPLITEVFTGKIHYKQGMAKSLIKSSMYALRRDGHPVFVLYVKAENIGAIKIYQDLGFVEMENIKIVQMTKETVDQLNSFDSEFSVYGHLELEGNNKGITYKVIESVPRSKKYEEQEIEPLKYVDSSHRAVFFAHIQDEVVGQIILREDWNRYAFIEDIRTKTQFKGKGIGKALIEKAKQWSVERGLGGLALETQNNNIDACKFYEKNGFVIGGFDRCFYKQFEAVKDEIVLHWYWLV